MSIELKTPSSEASHAIGFADPDPTPLVRMRRLPQRTEV
jgi:hypothetical protein